MVMNCSVFRIVLHCERLPFPLQKITVSTVEAYLLRCGSILIGKKSVISHLVIEKTLENSDIKSQEKTPSHNVA